MLAPKRLAAALAVAATLAAVAPAAANAQMPVDANGQICLSNAMDFGPLGPMGPYGQFGPYGPNGPMHGQPNPLGDVASCGGLITYILRGGTLQSFIQANIAAGH